MKEIFYELIKEAKDGFINIDGDSWNIGFNTLIRKGEVEESYYSDRNISTLVIKDENKFFTLLKEYITMEMFLDRKYYTIVGDFMKNKVKAIMAYLFVNANTEEFLNPEKLIRRKINFLKDDVFEFLCNEELIDMSKFVEDSFVKLKRVTQNLVMETPYKISVSFTKWDNGKILEVPLADISYGISDENGDKVCYVYAIMNSKYNNKMKSDENNYSKKVNRFLYKLDDGVMEQESDEYKAYRNGESDYYPENISDVTNGFVFALTVFISLLQKEGISKIRVVPYLPVRYLSREVLANNLKDEDRAKEFRERNKRIQTNATEKFMRTFRRVAYHMGESIELVGIPYGYDEFMTYQLYDKKEKLNNEILEEISNGVLSMEKEKRL